MVRTNVEKERRRLERLESLPSSERALKLAMIKKKEGRPLNGEERHALRMNGFIGTVYKLSNNVRKAEKADVRNEAIEKILELTEADFLKHSRSPQTSRIFQGCIKNGTHEHLERIMPLLSKDFVEMASDPFACFVISSFLRHTTPTLFTKLLRENIFPKAHLLVDTKPGLSVLSSVIVSPYCTSSSKKELLAASLIAPEEMKRVGWNIHANATSSSSSSSSNSISTNPIASGDKNTINSNKGGVLLTWTRPLPPHAVQQRLRELTERIVSKKSCDTQFSHLILDAALQVYDAVTSNDAVVKDATSDYVKSPFAKENDSEEWKSDVLEALRGIVKPTMLATLSLTGARLALRVFQECSPKGKRLLLQKLSDDAVKYASTASGAAFLCAVLDINTDAQVSHRCITSAWGEHMDELFIPVAFRHFSKLLQRLCMVNVDHKNHVIPQTWVELLSSAGALLDNECILRHRRLASRFLVLFLPLLIEQYREQKIKEEGEATSKPLSLKSALASMLLDAHALAQTEECDAALKKYVTTDISFLTLLRDVQGQKKAKTATKRTVKDDGLEGSSKKRKLKRGHEEEQEEMSSGKVDSVLSREEEEGSSARKILKRVKAKGVSTK